MRLVGYLKRNIPKRFYLHASPHCALPTQETNLLQTAEGISYFAQSCHSVLKYVCYVKIQIL